MVGVCSAGGTGCCLLSAIHCPDMAGGQGEGHLGEFETGTPMVGMGRASQMTSAAVSGGWTCIRLSVDRCSPLSHCWVGSASCWLQVSRFPSSGSRRSVHWLLFTRSREDEPDLRTCRRGTGRLFGAMRSSCCCAGSCGRPGGSGLRSSGSTRSRGSIVLPMQRCPSSDLQAISPLVWQPCWSVAGSVQGMKRRIACEDEVRAIAAVQP